MTITGIDSTGQSAGGNVVPPRKTTGTEDLEAELFSLEKGLETGLAADVETEVTPAATGVPSPVVPSPGVPSPVLPSPVVPDEAIPAEQDEVPSSRRRWWRTLTWRDAVAILTFVVAALAVTSQIWLHPDHLLRNDPQDQAFFEWMLAHGAQVISHGANPFFSDAMNYPDGVNMMANTSVLAVSIPLTPVTLWLGPHVSFNVFLTLALALTGISWYFVLSRKFVGSRLAAWIGALFCGFGPSMIAHAGGHPNIAAQFLVPLIIWRTLELRRPGRAIRNGLLLTGLLVWQAFINLEILFMTAVGLGVFIAAMGIARRRGHRGEATAFLRGLGVAMAVTAAVLAYPLSVQFFGPQSYQGLPWNIREMGADLGAFTAYSSHSVAGNASVASVLAQNPAEENAFFGWGMVILFFGLIMWMRKRVEAIALGVIALLFAAMSLGPKIFFNGKNTGVYGLWNALQRVPVLDSAVPTRWAMAITPVAGVVLALGVQRAIDMVRQQPSSRGPIRVAMVTAVAMALVPLIPVPLATSAPSPVPAFISSGEWKPYVGTDHTVVTLPLPSSTYSDPMRWSAATGLSMKIAGAYALLPGENPLDPNDHTARFQPPWRPTSGLVTSILQGNPVPEITDTRREMTLADLRYWRAGVVMLVPQAYDIEIRRAMTELLGFDPTWKDGAWIWDVRALVDNPNAVLTGPDDEA
jgi:hypothetical protein